MMVSCVEQINTNHNGNKKIGKNGKIKVKHNYHSYSVRLSYPKIPQNLNIYFVPIFTRMEFFALFGLFNTCFEKSP